MSCKLVGVCIRVKETGRKAPLEAQWYERVLGKNPEAVRVLRAKLVDIARKRGSPITYTDAYAAIAHIYVEGTKTTLRTLYGTLDEIADQNRGNREPPLFGLVVKHGDGLPGQGYFQKHCYLPNEHHPMSAALFRAHLERIYDYDRSRNA